MEFIYHDTHHNAKWKNSKVSLVRR